MTKHVEVMELVAQLKAAEEAFVLATVVRTVAAISSSGPTRSVARPAGSRSRAAISRLR